MSVTAGDYSGDGGEMQMVESAIKAFPEREAPPPNARTSAAEDRFSTFAIDVDTAAYSIARRSLLSEHMPAPSLVRVEEFINYFKYDYEPPSGGRDLFSIQADGSRSPLDPELHLLRIGIQAKAISRSERPNANLVFLVDTSCSMTSSDKLDLAKESMRIALGQLREGDRIAITTYAGSVDVILAPTDASNRRIIERAIAGLDPEGGTAMASGMDLAYQQAMAMHKPGALTRVVILSDGDANLGPTTPEAILDRIGFYVKEGITMSTIGFGDGNYRDQMMETLANKGNGNYYYIDSSRQNERVFGRDFTKMILDVAQDVKIQVELDPKVVESYRLVGYENRDIADQDFRNDQVDAGEIGAGHQVTALYELKLARGAEGQLGTIRVRAKKPGGIEAKETSFDVPMNVVDRRFAEAPADFRFAVAVMGAAELMRQSPYASRWTFDQVIEIAAPTVKADADRSEFVSLVKAAKKAGG
jgi:Ca-activated chloride channel family protein